MRQVDAHRRDDALPSVIAESRADDRYEDDRSDGDARSSDSAGLPPPRMPKDRGGWRRRIEDVSPTAVEHLGEPAFQVLHLSSLPICPRSAARTRVMSCLAAPIEQPSASAVSRSDRS